MKRYLFILAILLSVMSVTAQWEHQAHDVNRTQYYPEYATFLPTGGASIELTCGTDGAAQYQSPGLFGTFGDGDTVPDLFLMCMGDSGNANPHIVMITDDLVQLDTITLTSETGLETANWLTYSLCEYDSNVSTQEFCIWNYYDESAPYHLSILIYSFDFTASHEFTKVDEWVLNASDNIITTDTGTFNATGINMHGAQSRNIIECYDSDTCYVVSNDVVFKTDMMTHNTVDWINHTSAEAIMVDGTHAALPVFTDEFIYVLNDTTQHIYRINKSDGNYDIMLFDGGVTDYETMALYNCSSSDCVDGDELLLTDSTTDKAYMFDISDGVQLESSDALTGDTPYAWVEDWDSDGTEELCFADFGSAGTSTAKCEELNLFAFDTLDDDWDFNTTSDASCVESMVRVDMNADNKSDFIIGANMVLSSGNAYLPYVIQSLYDITDANNDIAHAYSLFDSANTSTGTLLSWYFGMGNNDTVFLTSSYPYEEEAIVNLPEFYNEPVQSIANPICNYSTVAFECTYANGCAIDDEYDHFGLCYDCFGDGAQANCYSAGEFFIHYDTWYCDVSGKAGQQNMTVQIFEDGYEDTNDSIVYEYIVGTVGCYNETDPGEVEVPYMNTPPTFTWYPTPLYPSPFCRDGAARFECLNWSCYYDYEGDDVWFAVDCDEDGDIDTVTDVGQGANFTCTFNYSENQSGAHTVTAYVYDLANEGTFEDSVGFSVTISNYTRQNVTDAGELLCSSSSFIRNDGTVIIPTAPVIEEPEGNYVYELYKDFSDVFNTTPAIVGWLVTLLGSGLVAWIGYKSNEGNPVTGAILTFAGLSVFHSVMGIYGWTGVIVIVCVAVGFGIYRHVGRGE